MANSFQSISEDWLYIGKIVAPQGIKGEVRVYPESDFPERFETAGQRWLSYPETDQLHAIELLKGRYLANKGLYVIQLQGIHDRAGAEALRSCSLWVRQSDRPRLEAGEFYLLDLVGLDVVLQETQETIGQVISLVPAGNDLLEVQLLDSSQKTALIPFVEAIVPHVDLEQGRIEISPPPGLLDSP